MRAWIHAPLFVGVFLVASMGWGAVLEHWEVPLEVSGPEAIKGDHMRRHREDYDVVFVGSSRVYRQFPAYNFSNRMKAIGLEVTAYNMGLPGMRFLESLDVTDRLLRLRSEKLRWIVLELQDPEPNHREATYFTNRNVLWHTPHLSWVASARALASTRPLATRLGEVWGHLAQGLLHQARVGTALPFFRHLFGWRDVIEDISAGGFFPLELHPNRDALERREALLGKLEQEPDWLTKRVARAEARGTVEPWVRAELEALVERGEKQGVRVSFMVWPPSASDYFSFGALGADPALARVFAFSPRDFGALYSDPALRYDVNHLNWEGSRRLTASLVQQFAAYVRRKDPARDESER